MKVFLFTLLNIFLIAKTFGQKFTNSYGRVVVEITKEKKSKKVEPKIEIKSFVTGDSSFVKSLEKQIMKSIKISQDLKKGKYVVGVKFITSKDGTVSDVACDSDPGFGLCQELMNIIKKSSRWIPAKQYPDIIQQSDTHQ